MKLSEFLFRLKLQVPNIKETGITDSELTSLINQGCDEVNLYTKIYKGVTGGYTDFNISANQAIYQLSSVATTFLGADNKPLHFKDSNDDWVKIYPTTKSWVESKYQNWMNADSVAIPQWYWVEGDELGFYPAPSTLKTNGARLYHLKKRTDMSGGDSYPWTGGATEITALKPLDDAIIAYCIWKLSPAIGAVSDADLRYREFIQECSRGAKQIRRRPDLIVDTQYKANVC